MELPDSLIAEAETLLAAYRAAKLRLVTAESCTGGLVAACLTAIPGASDVVERGFVTYSNEAKTELIGVPAGLGDRHGAVSAQVVRAMAEGALANSRADAAVAVTGVAGPGGETPGKPVGVVYLCAARKGCEPLVERHQFHGDRHQVRIASVEAAFTLLRQQLDI